MTTNKQDMGLGQGLAKVHRQQAAHGRSSRSDSPAQGRPGSKKPGPQRARLDTTPGSFLGITPGTFLGTALLALMLAGPSLAAPGATLALPASDHAALTPPAFPAAATSLQAMTDVETDTVSPAGTAATPVAASSTPTSTLYTARRIGQLWFEPCTLRLPMAPMMKARALCSSLDVPENRAKPDGRKITLPIAWLPARGAKASQPGEHSPLVMLPGGPGQSALETWPALAQAFARVRQDRPVLLVDQRGTGSAHPLHCVDTGDEAGVLMMTTAQYLETMRACAQQLAKEADLRQYGTLQAVDDLEAVRKAMDIPALNLLGISYGARVAQHYAERHPTRARSLLLDSGILKNHQLGEITAEQMNAALAGQLSACERDVICTRTMGHPQQQLDALMARLSQQPVTVNVMNPTTRKHERTTLTANGVASLIRLMIYDTATSRALPMMIHKASSGDFGMMASMTRQVDAGLGHSMAMGMYMSVACTEDIDSMIKRHPAYDPLQVAKDTVVMARACRQWPRSRLPAGFHAPLKSTVPVLSFSGEFDPVRTPNFEVELTATLPNARHLTLRGQAHSVLGQGCMPRLMAEFLKAPRNVETLNVDCLNNLPAARPALNAMELMLP